MRFLLTTAALWTMWCLLSGKFDALHLGGGAACAVLVAAAARGWRGQRAFPVLRLLAYVPWLLREVFVSNLRVARMVLSRRMPIAPRFVEIEAGVSGDRALTLLGCSTTLTPGTVTVEAGDGRLLVHALDDQAARSLCSGEMARRIRGVFKEEGGGQP